MLLKRAAILFVLTTLAATACGGGEDTVATVNTTSPPTVSTSALPIATTTTAPAPTTTVVDTTTTTVVAGIVPGDDPDVDAIVFAYTIAFDSVSDYETKAPFIDDPTGLEETVALYLTTGETMGGIGVVVTEVIIDGDTATLTFDLLFNDNPSYPDQAGRAVLTGAGWQVPRGAFCSLMSSARVGCPDS